MILTYNLKRDFDIRSDKKTMKSCDEGAKAFQSCTVMAAKALKKGVLPIIVTWVASRFYTKKITKDKIEYDFYLIK